MLLSSFISSLTKQSKQTVRHNQNKQLAVSDICFFFQLWLHSQLLIIRLVYLANEIGLNQEY